MTTKQIRTTKKQLNGLKELQFIKGVLRGEHPEWFSDDGVLLDEPINLIATIDNLTLKEYIQKKKLTIDSIYLNEMEDMLVLMASYSNATVGCKQVNMRLKNILQTVKVTHRTFPIHFLDIHLQASLISVKMRIDNYKKENNFEDDEENS